MPGPRDRDTGLVNVIIDTPTGSRNKYKYDEELGLFRLHKLLPIGAAFPFDFGFVPRTLADDGDSLDVVVLGEASCMQGCLVTVRLLGVLEAEQIERGATIRNDRLIGTPQTQKIRPRERSLADLPPKLLDQIEHFFVGYNHAEGRQFVPLGRRGPVVAARCIERAMRAYRGAPGSKH